MSYTYGALKIAWKGTVHNYLETHADNLVRKVELNNIPAKTKSM